MILANQTWREIEGLSREAVVVIPTGALEQHGSHLPLFTDSILVGAVASGVESRLADKTLLTPVVWLGVSDAHLSFPGTLSSTFGAFEGAVTSIIESLVAHGFYKFFVINGHGGNSAPNAVALRTLKLKYPKLLLGHADYFQLASEAIASEMTGPYKGMTHADESETSMVLHLHPELVRTDRLRRDGLFSDPPIAGMIHGFDERSEEGSIGASDCATASKGKAMLDACIEKVAANIEVLADGYVLRAKE